MSSASTERPVSVTADLVASVIAVHVTVDQEVEADDVMLVMESMKMEMPITAPVAGRVVQIGVAVGDVVQEGDLLVAIQR